MFKSSTFGAIALGLLATACAHVEPPPTGALKPGTAWVANSPDWASEAEAVFAEATAYVDTVAATRPDGTWGVILDVDETVINNVDYQISLDQRGDSYAPESWYAWTQEEAATLVPGAAAFIKHVNARGGHVGLVTNRRDTEQLATERNLEALGLRRHYDYRVLLTRALPDASGEKDARFDLVPKMLATQGYPDVEIIAYLGDNKGDKPAEPGDWRFFCIDQGGMYGDYCAAVPRSG
ncbi:MAG: HAD family acid phosphatase [Pseudomonadota bacterium]